MIVYRQAALAAAAALGFAVLSSGAAAQTGGPGCDADKLAYARKIGVPCSSLGDRLPQPGIGPVEVGPAGSATPAAIIPPGPQGRTNVRASSTSQDDPYLTVPIAPPPPPGMALVYIYRFPDFISSATPADFDIDRIGIGGLWNSEYTWFYVPAGDHKVRQVWGGLALISVYNLVHSLGGTMHWNDGQTYYYEFHMTLAVRSIARR